MMGDGYHQYEYGGRVADEEFDEEEIWAVMLERKDGNSPNARKKKSKEPFSPPAGRLSTAARMIPPKSNGCSESGGGAAGDGGGRGFQQSAPVNIPDWSKIYRRGSSAVHSWHRRSNGFGGDGYVVSGCYEEGDEEEEDGDDRVPPHEWIARKLARSQISSFSVFEGVGRTLKGRDLSKVRNAVLTKTGFLE